MTEWGFGLSNLANRICILVVCSAAISACQPELNSTLPAGPAAYDTIRNNPGYAPTSYQLRPGDKIAVKLYEEEELSQDELIIDGAGMIALPLIGEIKAAGYSPGQLSREIEGAYSRGFIRNPQANVLLLEAEPSTVSVEGEVKTAGVYEIEPGYTLLSAMALAGSPTDKAKLSEVLIFRTVEGQRMGGRFDLTAVRAGRMPDPELLSGDVIVVGYSKSRGTYRDMLTVMPSVLGTFVTISRGNN